MFSRVLITATKSSATGAVGMTPRIRPFAAQTRFLSKQASDGIKGRAMPLHRPRATAPVDNLDATLTIRVRIFPTESSSQYTDSLPLGWPRLPRSRLRCQLQYLRRGRLHHLSRWLPRVYDRSLLPWPDSSVHPAPHWQLRSPVERP